MAKASEFATGHHDRVTVLHTNFDASRILTGSIDHRIKVWNRDPKTGERTLLDTFTAHDSDIRDAKFLHPTLGSYIASIGNDLKCHVWMEEPSQAPNNGHRFRRIATIPSTPRVPFVSMDLKTVDNVYTYLALIDRQGLLSVYEPSSPDDLKDWILVDQFNVCGAHPPSRGDETSFKVRFDQNATPLAYINSVSDDRSQLSLVVSALNDVKVYRSVIPTNFGGGDGSSHRLMFYEAAKLPRHPALVRDVAWAPFSVRGTDRVATACKDGSVRIFELAVLEGPSTGLSNGAGGGVGSTSSAAPGIAASNASTFSTQTASTRSYASQQRQQPQSSLTSAIAGRTAAHSSYTHSPSQSQSQSSPASSTTNTNTTTNTTSGTNPSTSASMSGNPHSHPGADTANTEPHITSSHASPIARTGYTFPFITSIASTTTLAHAHPDAWSLSFDAQGQVLLTNGADGVTKIWRKSVLGGQWLVFAGQEVLDGDGDEGSSEESEKDGLEIAEG
ncbi:uncharacterized protein A1O9_04116 [Exophiala aquamarina CBS 119918]|uniref:Uncharacterized protein n=1 Tax=Exophiala aquamarina CBS 119918 TaxID=1182545 RepID=A0A072PHT0_9EURO|nr:uncharacterized protein A1O9_04116 [Exophiala aquamarina CBS 119918]KEF59272.1 hypothetical protein A1O9_04116 [Exophiala aquamarina CBS 119918]